VKQSFVIAVMLAGAAGASQAVVRTVDADAVCASVRTAVAARAAGLGLNASVTCTHAVSLSLPAGAMDWLLPAKEMAWTSGAVRLTFQVRTQDGDSQAVTVPVVLALSSKAWVAARDLRPGDAVDASAVEWRDVSWPVGQTFVTPPQLAPVGRAKTALKSGEIVLASRLVPDTERLQGDAVSVTFRSEGITLEMPAVLSANAQVGQVARVQLKGRRDTLQGVLVDASHVIVER
jgi:flagella basal body P-ring formation protein FlgA